jgi:hypothetical protein
MLERLINSVSTATRLWSPLTQGTLMMKVIYVRFEVFTAVNMKAVFGDINTQFVPHRKHYVSATEPTRLMLCKI